jgi:glyoxylase-like metal-dependent hydrolase (beta-lactamase superfamily II)
LTHLHKDHAGGVTRLQAEGVQVWGGEGASAYAQNEKARAYFEGNVPQLDRVLTAGECFTLGTLTFQILATPGHTSACVTYLVTIDNIRCAFTGDLVMPNGTIGYAGSFDYDRELLKGSLQHVLQYDFDALLTGHMLHSTQPEGFWLHDGKSHVLEVLRAGNDGKW